jgi:drug/metabolite transporter (DMT)-like permease
MQVTKTMLIALVTPVAAVLLGMIVLHEEFNWRLLAGGACIIAGLALIVVRKRHLSGKEPELVPKP